MSIFGVSIIGDPLYFRNLPLWFLHQHVVVFCRWLAQGKLRVRIRHCLQYRCRLHSEQKDYHQRHSQTRKVGKICKKHFLARSSLQLDTHPRIGQIWLNHLDHLLVLPSNPSACSSETHRKQLCLYVKLS